MKIKKQLGEKLCGILTFLVCLLPAFSAGAQKIFDANNVSGRYVITDYLNQKVILDIGKANKTDYAGLPEGPGTVTARGRKLIGNWSLTECDNILFLAFKTYDYIDFVYSLPSGTQKFYQIVLSQDGRASFNISELLKKNADCIKFKRASGTSNKSGRKKTSRKK